MAGATVACRRCGRPAAPALSRAPLPGPLGRDVLEHNCADCWAEWLRVEVMVINELRLNFMESAAQETLNRQMLDFLDPASRGTPPGGNPPAGGSPAGSGSPPAGGNA